MRFNRFIPILCALVFGVAFSLSASPLSLPFLVGLIVIAVCLVLLISVFGWRRLKWNPYEGMDEYCRKPRCIHAKYCRGSQMMVENCKAKGKQGGRFEA